MKRKIPSRYKKKFRAILKFINEAEYETDFDIVVVIKSPLYGQLFFLTDLPVKFSAEAQSIDEDFSNIITCL